MSPRPKRVNDIDLLAAATRTAIRLGAEHTRLSDVAVESGLAPATLIQRYGSRKGVLDAVSSGIAAQVAAALRDVNPLSVHDIAHPLASLDSVSHVAFFAGRRSGAPAYATELRKQIGFMLGRGVEVGWIAPCDIATLARQIQVGFLGLTIVCLLEHLPLQADAIAVMIEEILAPYL